MQPKLANWVLVVQKFTLSGDSLADTQVGMHVRQGWWQILH